MCVELRIEVEDRGLRLRFKKGEFRTESIYPPGWTDFGTNVMCVGLRLEV